VRRGKAADMYAIEHKSECLLASFLNDIATTHTDEFHRLNNVFDHVAESGPIANPDIYKPLRDGLYEVKVGVLRIVCFESKRGLVCTHGFIKSSQKTPINEIKTGRWLRSIFLVEEAKGKINVIE
jgi:hypothetical protein